MNKQETIKALLDFSEKIRYVAIYQKEELVYEQRAVSLDNSSSLDTDRFEELLVNPTLLKLSSQRGNIDCGGLDYLIVGYGNFFQLVVPLIEGHLSVCLEKLADLNHLSKTIIEFFHSNYKA